MDAVLEGAKTGAVKLYNTIKDYRVATSEAEDLSSRLELLSRVLQKVPKDDDELLREAVERASRTIDESYSRVAERLQKNDGIWKQVKDFAKSSSDRELFAQIASKIQMSIEDLSTPLNLHIAHGQQGIQESIMGLHTALENIPAHFERIIKQTAAKVRTEYVREPVEESNDGGRSTADTNASPAVSSSELQMEMIPKYSWNDLIWEDGRGPSSADPESCLIRKGGFSSVFKAKLRCVGDAALKHFNVDPQELMGRRFRDFKRECLLLQKVSTHPNVVSFYGVIKQPPSVGIVLDMAKGGSLFSAMNEESNTHWINLPTVLKLKALTGVLAAVSYIHSTGVVHADLKPRNVLFARPMSGPWDTPTLWLTDFGLSRTTRIVKNSHGSTLDPQAKETTGGTLGFMSPETVDGLTKPNEKSDIFSLAMTIWAALTCEEPFEDAMHVGHYLHLVKEKHVRPNLDDLPGDTPSRIVKLLQHSWDTDPENRPSIQELLDQWDTAVANATVDQFEKAAKRRDFRLVDDFRKQVSIEAADDNGDTVLHRLIKKKDRDAAKWLLLNENLDFDVNAQNSEGKTFLHLAVETSDIVLSEIICMRYPRFDIEDCNRQTELSLLLSLDKQSSLFRHICLGYVNLLAEAAVDHLEEFAKQRDYAKVHQLQDKLSLDLVDDAGDSVFHRLIKGNDIDSVLWLLSDEAIEFDVNSKDGEGKTILHLAVENSDVTLTDRIYVRQPNLDIKDVKGRTVSSYVASLGKKNKLYQRLFAK